MANYTIDKFTYGGNTYKLNDKDAMPKAGGTFTGEVTFNDTVTASDVTADSLVVQGNTSVVNGLQVSTINGVTVGSDPAFTDTTYTASSPISISNDNNITHNTSGVTANTYGSATQVPKITVNATGHITAVTNTTITGVTPASHTHGDITNGGDITATAPTIASGDKIIINDESASKITNGPSFGTSTSTYLRNDGAWGTPANTTYTFANGTNGFTVTPSGGSAQTVTVTPSITNNITGSGTSGYLTKFNGTNTITSGPALNSSGSTTKYLCEKGTWQQLPTASTAFQTVTVGDVELAATNSTDIEFIADEGITLTGDNSNDENKLTIKNSGAIYSLMSGFTTTAGSATSGSYLSVKWSVPNIGGITTPYDGMRIAIKIPMIGVGTAGVLLSIDNGTAWHPVSYNVNTVLTSHYPKDSVKYFTYDASQQMAGYASSNVKTTYTGVWKGDSNYDSNSNTYTSAYCDTAAGTQAKTAICTSYTLTENTYIPILFVYANSYNGKITLNINSKGAKDIYINGTVSSSSNKTLPAGTYIAYYDGTGYQIRTDGLIPGTTSGNLTGPSSATENHVATFGSSKTVLKDSGYTIGKSVPSDAVFTDTHNSHKVTVTNGTATATSGTITYVETVNSSASASSGDIAVTTTRKSITVPPTYQYSTTDLTPGTSALTTGTLYFVYE